ncbi:GH25 family lysozyme [Pontibacter sp. G13]|uniref:GH25 family lysozyme n=1 Tax=Pontibacter sp. G13 TaxID=3074898 RepID=UPI00288A45BD|nr:GH25 family lysozyme [Pontibacter sp. G13]WNJ20040.1 GH25 family lysozyme [Pontibacter sp. G13]
MRMISLPLAASVLLLVAAMAGCAKSTESSNSPSSSQATPEPAPTPDPSDDLPAYGLDLSHFNGDLEDELLPVDSITFVFVKATEGLTYEDPDFSHNWQTAKSKGLLRGAYHFYRTDDDPIEQARFFLRTVGTLGMRDFPLVLDIEQGSMDGYITTADLQSDLISFLSYLESHTGRRPILYSGESFCNTHLTHADFAQYPLWLAEYNSRTTPQIPTTWDQSGWVFWQKSESYKIDGTTSDFDLFNGTRGDLDIFLKTTQPGRQFAP